MLHISKLAPILALFILAGCIETTEEQTIDRQLISDARAHGWTICWMFSAPDGCDPCLEGGLYGDGSCDAFCGEPDPDCDAPLQQCGGGTGLACGDDEFCDYDDGICGDTERVGVCRPRPAECNADDVIQSFCGCDEVTYRSECDAATNGVDIAHEGPCDGSCPDAEDPNVHYMHASLEDPFLCRSLFFNCEPHQRSFSDECGCGCIDECQDAEDPRVHYMHASLEDPFLCRSLFFSCEPHQRSFSDECGCGCIDDCPEGQQLCEGCEGTLTFCADADEECPDVPCSPPNPDCRDTGCADDEECTQCSTDFVCLSVGAEC